MKLSTMAVVVGLSLAACGDPPVIDKTNVPLTDNGDGTATDPETGFMWTIHDNGLKPIGEPGEPGVTGESYLNWNGAMNYCETLALAGYDDWGLPDIDSLESLFDRDARSYCGTFGSDAGDFRVYCRIRAPITLTDPCVWTSTASDFPPGTSLVRPIGDEVYGDRPPRSWPKGEGGGPSATGDSAWKVCFGMLSSESHRTRQIMSNPLRPVTIVKRDIRRALCVRETTKNPR